MTTATRRRGVRRAGGPDGERQRGAQRRGAQRQGLQRRGAAAHPTEETTAQRRQPGRRQRAEPRRTSPGTEPKRRLLARLIDGLGGHGGAAIFLLALSEPLCAFTGRVFDHAVRVEDDLHQMVWTVSGHNSQHLLYLLIVGAILVAVAGLRRGPGLTSLRNASRPPVAALLLGTLAVWNVGVHIFQHTGPFLIATSVLTLFFIVAIIISPPTTATFRAIGILLGVVCVTVLLYRVAEPTLAASPCRTSDGKCGITGDLLEGYFPQENFLAVVIALMSPSIAFLRRVPTQIVVGLLALVVTLETGSRAAQLSVFVAGYSVIWIRLKARRGAANWRPSIVLRVAPLIALVASVWVFEIYSGQELTGRGQIFAAVRNQIHGLNAIIGPGPSDLTDAFLNGGNLTFLPTHEHGQAPHLIGRMGYVGLLLFAIMLLTLLRPRVRGQWSQLEAVGVMLCATASTLFVTESIWKFDVRDDNFWSLLLLVGCLSVRSTAAPDEAAGRRGRRRSRRARRRPAGVAVPPDATSTETVLVGQVVGEVVGVVVGVDESVPAEPAVTAGKKLVRGRGRRHRSVSRRPASTRQRANGRTRTRVSAAG